MKLRPTTDDESGGVWSFREAVKGLIWVSSSTRPDISNAVRDLARCSHDPSLVHWKAVLKIMASLLTRDLGLSYPKGIRSDGVCRFGLRARRCRYRSISGGVVTCAGAAVAWLLRTSRCVTMVNVMSGKCCNRGLRTRRSTRSGGVDVSTPAKGKTLYSSVEDNAGAVPLVENLLS